MTEIRFSPAEKKLISHKIQSYFQEQLDQDIGSFDAEFLLNFFTEEIGPYYYNRGLSDAQTILKSKLDDITDAFYDMEKPIKTG
ncbi:MAG: DUF2164 domain-containing protein [Emcibacter sp.]|nr:DUF2164 domain-containing protein [Emcibacter sp.]